MSVSEVKRVAKTHVQHREIPFHQGVWLATFDPLGVLEHAISHKLGTEECGIMIRTLRCPKPNA